MVVLTKKCVFHEHGKIWLCPKLYLQKKVENGLFVNFRKKKAIETAYFFTLRVSACAVFLVSFVQSPLAFAAVYHQLNRLPLLETSV